MLGTPYLLQRIGSSDVLSLPSIRGALTVKGLPVWLSLLRQNSDDRAGALKCRALSCAEGSFWRRDVKFSVEMEAEFVIPSDSLYSSWRQGARMHAGRHAHWL